MDLDVYRVLMRQMSILWACCQLLFKHHPQNGSYSCKRTISCFQKWSKGHSVVLVGQQKGKITLSIKKENIYHTKVLSKVEQTMSSSSTDLAEASAKTCYSFPPQHGIYMKFLTQQSVITYHAATKCKSEVPYNLLAFFLDWELSCHLSLLSFQKQKTRLSFKKYCTDWWGWVSVHRKTSTEQEQWNCRWFCGKTTDVNHWGLCKPCFCIRSPVGSICLRQITGLCSNIAQVKLLLPQLLQLAQIT